MVSLSTARVAVALPVLRQFRFARPWRRVPRLAACGPIG